MTQIARYGHMLKVHIGKIRAKAKAHYRTEGSVLRGDRRGWLDKLETAFDIESTDPAEKVAQVVRVAKNGCYVRQSLLNPVALAETVMLNGHDLRWQTD